MIKADQPTIFDSSLIAAVSSTDDGNMKFGVGEPEEVLVNRRRFLEEAGLDINHTTNVVITYETEDFAKYRVVRADEKGDGMTSTATLGYADALVVDTPGHALFLPIADCVGAILYSPVHKVLMVSHIGRHSAEVEGGRKSVEYLKAHYGIAPEELQVWLSPAVGSDSYPLHRFEGRSLHNVIVSQLVESGVRRDAIEVSEIDTSTSKNYFSYSQFLKGNETIPGRFAVVAMMVEQGEPAA